MEKKRFIGTVHLYLKGKNYGSTTRQVNAKSKSDARKVLKRNFKYGNNKVTVTGIKSLKEIRRAKK